MRILLAFATLLNASLCFGQNVKNLRVSDTEVAPINAAVGYSTILQFDARPSSAVLGDQDSFKVEYVGNSLTIKPLRSGVKTNLFVFTDYERFNFRLISGSASTVDYIVKVTRRRANQPVVPSDVEVVPNSTTDLYAAPPQGDELVTKRVGRAGQCRPFTMTLDSLSYPRLKPWLIINFSLSSISGNEEAIDPGSLQILESEKPIPAETLYLEAAKLPSNGNPVHGTFMLSRKTPSRVAGLTLLLTVPTKAKGHCSKIKIRLAGGKNKGASNEAKAKN